MSSSPVVLLDVVGLTPAHVGADTPRLRALARSGAAMPLAPVLPAVTCPAQATLLTGKPPGEHGVVANGWLHRDTMEIRFWQQSNRLIQAEPLYVTARRRAARRGESFTCAKLFWWFNQGAAVDWSLTPKPHYGSDGSKHFGIYGTPEGFAPALEKELGPFPFVAFWGPRAGLASSEWIARAAAATLRQQRPTLTLVYLPHLDYDLQRFGPDLPQLAHRLAEVDRCVGIVLDAAARIGAIPVVVSEYGLDKVDEAVFLNRILRRAGYVQVRDGPFGEMIDPFASRAFAVCDHQVAHVYVQNPADVVRVDELLASQEGVARTYAKDARQEVGLRHQRSGDIIAFSGPDRWFAYPYWLDERRAPDFARTVDIHRKCGYDPCELLFDPQVPVPQVRAAMRLLQKKLGLRYRMDVTGVDTSVVKGSHGIAPARPEAGPVILGPSITARSWSMSEVSGHVLELMGLET